MSEYILTEEQFQFLLQYHEEIERAYIDDTLNPGGKTFIDTLLEMEEYKQLFAEYPGWDDVADRFEDTPGYDWSLRVQIRNELREILQKRAADSSDQEE